MTESRPESLAFATPDLDGPLDLDARLAAAPPDAHVLGWLVNSVTARAAAAGVIVGSGRPLGPVTKVPLADYLRILAEAASKLAPDEPPRKNLYTLGLGVYPAFVESKAGRAILATVGTLADPRRALSLVAKSYGLTGGHTIAEVVVDVDGLAIVHLQNVWSFPDVYHVGLFAGAAQAVSNDPIRVQVCPVSMHECYVELRRV